MLEFPRAFGPALARVSIRNQPEDFQVRERLGFELSGTGEHAYLYIRKTGANTGWVSDRLAEHLGLRHFDVSYAGKKDRHAVTEQWFSCWLPGGGAVDLEALEIEGVEFLSQTRHIKKLRRGDHESNHFTLRIRLHSEIDADALQSRLTLVAAQGFPNYFGAQRFGRDGANLDRAREMMKELAPNPTASPRKMARKQRDMVLSAARSYLFNLDLARVIEEGRWPTSELGWLVGDPPHRDTALPDPPEGFEDWARVLAGLGLKASERRFAVIPEALEWQLEGHGEEKQLVVSFVLPPGAYATSLVEELFDYEE